MSISSATDGSFPRYAPRSHRRDQDSAALAGDPYWSSVTRTPSQLHGTALLDVFNHSNYRSYVTTESNKNHGNPARNLDVAYLPRMLQVGFQVASERLSYR